MCISRLTILRHGQVQGGAIFRGLQDDPLTEIGWQQMQESLSNNNYDLVISSPLIRCARFARQYAHLNNLKLVEISDFKEIYFGDWEGKSYNQINQESPLLLERFYQDTQNHPPPNGETLIDFQKRVISGLLSVIETYQGKNIVLICHGGVQKMIIAHALKMPLSALHNIDTPYACLTRMSIFHDQEQISWVLNHHG